MRGDKSDCPRQCATDRLARWLGDGFGDMVKAIVDVERRVMAIGGELHSEAGAAQTLSAYFLQFAALARRIRVTERTGRPQT